MTGRGVLAMAAVATASLLVSGCRMGSQQLVALDPGPQPVAIADIRGVVLTEGGEVRFSVVDDVRWTPSALEIDGVVDDPESPDDERYGTLSFSYDAVSHLLVGDRDAGRARTAAAVGGVLGWVAGWGFLYWLISGIAGGRS